MRSKIYRGSVELSFRAGRLLPFFGEGFEHFILAYHGVTLDGSKLFNTRHEPLSFFEKHIRFLTRNFHVIPLINFFEQRFIPGKINVALTFDDGYRNNFLYVKPILEKYNAPATIFITGMNQVGCEMLWADFLNIISYYYDKPVSIDGEIFKKTGGNYISDDTGRSLYHVIKNDKPGYQFKEQMYQAFSPAKKIFEDETIDDYWRLMTDNEIIECSRSPVIHVGSHGFYHNNLGHLTKETATEELIKSKYYLENLIQKPVQSIAYPDSSYNRELVNIAEEIGLSYQLAADGLKYKEDKTDARLRDRIGIYNCGQCGTQLLLPIKNHFN